MDRTALNRSATQAEATISNLTNVTAGGTPLTTQRGWYYTFAETGEKALASPIIFNNRILFTTYAPTVDQEYDNPCAVRYGRSYLHTVNLLTARPAALSDDLPTPTSRSQALEQSTPAPTPTLLVDDEGRVITIVGTEVVGEGALGDPRLRKRRWMQLPPDEANTIREEHSVQDTEGGE
jgi:type IV pilus assembly protein PilY1